MVTKYFKPFKPGRSKTLYLLYNPLHSASMYVYHDKYIIRHKTIGRYNNITKFRATELVERPLPIQLIDNALKNRRVHP